MKKIILVCALIFSLILCTGCNYLSVGIGIPISEEYKLAGVYEDETGLLSKFELARDGSMRVYIQNGFLLGDFKAKDGKIRFNCGSDLASLRFTYELDGEDLTLYAEGAEILGLTCHWVEKGKGTVNPSPNRYISSIEGMFKTGSSQRLLLTEDGTAWTYTKGNRDNTLQKGSYSIQRGHISFSFTGDDWTLAEGENFEYRGGQLILLSDLFGYVVGEVWEQTTDATYQSTLKKVKSTKVKSKKTVETVEEFYPEEYYYDDSQYYDDEYYYDDYYDEYEEYNDYDDYDEYIEDYPTQGSTSNTIGGGESEAANAGTLYDGEDDDIEE